MVADGCLFAFYIPTNQHPAILAYTSTPRQVPSKPFMRHVWAIFMHTINIYTFQLFQLFSLFLLFCRQIFPTRHSSRQQPASHIEIGKYNYMYADEFEFRTWLNAGRTIKNRLQNWNRKCARV